jgi:hypothetical protein
MRSGLVPGRQQNILPPFAERTSSPVKLLLLPRDVWKPLALQ